jgi:hypothetical protein
VFEIGDDLMIGTSVVNGARYARWVVANSHCGRLSVVSAAGGAIQGLRVYRGSGLTTEPVATIITPQTALEIPGVAHQAPVGTVCSAVSAGDVMQFKGSGDAPFESATVIYLTYLGSVRLASDLSAA